MKKQARKLTLNRETVRELDAGTLQAVAAGTGSNGGVTCFWAQTCGADTTG